MPRSSPRCQLLCVCVARAVDPSPILRKGAQQISFAAPEPFKLDPACVRLLSTELELSEEQVYVILCKQPGMHQLGARHMLRQLSAAKQALAGVLQLSEDQLKQLLQRVPMLLTMRPADVRQRYSRLVDLVGQQPELARGLVVAEPMWLLVSYDGIRSRLGALGALLCMPVARLIKLCTVQPELLVITPEQLLGRITAIAHALGIGNDDATNVLRRAPLVLTWRPATVNRKVEELAGALDVTREQALQLVLTQPGLLLKPPAGLGVRWRRLQHAASHNAQWSAQLRSYSLGTLALLLSVGAARYSRLEFMQQFGMSKGAPLAEALQCSDEQFLARFPSWDTWRSGDDDEWTGGFAAVEAVDT